VRILPFAGACAGGVFFGTGRRGPGADPVHDVMDDHGDPPDTIPHSFASCATYRTRLALPCSDAALAAARHACRGRPADEDRDRKPPRRAWEYEVKLC
jgi:hypothetical protein